MLNFKVHYLPPYEREVWHYKEADTDLFNNHLKYLIGTKHYDMADICTKTIRQ